MTDINLNELRGIAEAALREHNALYRSPVTGALYVDGEEAQVAADLANAVSALLSRLEAAETVIADALDAGEHTGYSHHKDPVMRILSAYTKGTDRD